MLKEFSSREAAGNLSGRDKQVPAVKDCRFTQTAFIKIAQVQDAGGIIVTVDDGRLAIQLRGF